LAIVLLLLASSVLAGPLTLTGSGASHRFRTAVTLAPNWVIGDYQQKISERVQLDAQGTCAGTSATALYPGRFPKDRVLGAAIPQDCRSLILIKDGFEYARFDAMARFSDYRIVEKLHNLEIYQLK
jgi:hypothetical protein